MGDVSEILLKVNFMFLFLSDYASIAKSHIDYKTTNISFIRMYSLLNKMGIKNNKFFLMLLDKDLLGIDPHNLKDESVELKLRIVAEANLNPWYYFRSILRIPETGSDGSHFLLSRANLNMIWLYFNHIDNLQIIPRQFGKTIASVSIASCVTYNIGFRLKFAMLTKDDALRKENVQRLKDIRDAHPPWFIFKQSKDADNMENVSYEYLNNEYKTFVAQTSKQGADRLGRGMTVPSQHWDEIVFFPNISITYPVAISTTNAAIESAKKHNQPYGNILTTTAGSLDTDEGMFVHNELMCNALHFSEHFYDLENNEKLKTIVRENNPKGMIYSEFSYKQLGKTDEWFRMASARTAGDENKIANDYLNRWTHGTGKKSPIDKHILDKINSSKKECKYVQYIDEFIIKWYIPKEIVVTSELKKIPIIIGSDASENVGRDFTSFVFVDARTAEVIGNCICNSSNIMKVAAFICTLMIKYENIVFIPERNSVGVAIIDYCLLQLENEGINPFFRIYNNVIQEFDSNKLNKAELYKVGLCHEYKQYFGFRTSSSTRPFLYKTVFKHALNIGCDRVNDSTLISQMNGLVVKNGRIDHGSGGNDDSVIAYILSMYLLFFGNNLHMYSFSNGNIDNLLTDIPDEDNPNMSKVDIEKATKLKSEISVLTKQMNMEKDPTSKIMMMHDIQKLKEQLPINSENIIVNIPSVDMLKQKSSPAIGNTTFEQSKYINYYLSAL